LIDCSPALSISTINALVISDTILSPIEPEFLSLKAFSILNQALDNVGLKVDYCFASKIDNRKIIHQNVLQAFRESYPNMMLDSSIRINVAIAEAQALGNSVFDYDSKCNGAIDYEKLTIELLKKLGK